MRRILFLSPFFILVFLAILAPLIAPYPKNLTDLEAIKLAPSFTHLFGTDLLGRDLYTSLLYALQNSLFIGVFASLLSLFIALIFVLIAHLFAYNFFMRILEMCLAIHGLILMMIFQSFFQGNILVISILLALTSWMYLAKMLDGAFQKYKSMDFYTCALMLGASKFRALVSEILPACVNLIFVLFILNIGHSISHEATLSFFGLGVPIGEFSLGTLLSDGAKGLFLGAWWLVLFPSLVLLFLILPLLAFANAMQDKFGMKL